MPQSQLTEINSSVRFATTCQLGARGSMQRKARHIEGLPVNAAGRPRLVRLGRGPAALLISLCAALGGCSSVTIVDKHGHQFTDNDLRQVQPGMSQEQVKLSLGTPDTVSAIGGGAFYYISSTTAQTMFLAPKETDRRVLAIYFNPVGGVERVANYGLKDGKLFDFVKSETPSHARDENLLKQLFRNLGTGVGGGSIFGN